jgi:DNA-binding response OmpR family regulator
MKAVKTNGLSNFNLVVCSFAQTGKISGMKLLEMIRKSAPQVPVISTKEKCQLLTYIVVLTYKDGSDIGGKCLELGAVDVLAMPLTPEVVRNRVANVS